MLTRLLAAGALILSLPSVVAAAERPVVVELFTSEGCSSCPPADRYLTELSRDRRDVLPLAFHVTYWNNLGWKDPFSLDAATRRQAVYGTRFGDGSYTPEMVVDGQKGVVGSDRSSAEAAIGAAKRTTSGSAPLTIARKGGTVTIRVGQGAGTGHVILVGFDPQHITAVGRGENGGRTLTESNIVRSIQSVGQWTGASLTLNAGSPAGEEFAALLEASDGRIIGAARADASLR